MPRNPLNIWLSSFSWLYSIGIPSTPRFFECGDLQQLGLSTYIGESAHDGLRQKHISASMLPPMKSHIERSQAAEIFDHTHLN
ncbi:hypothetical protein BJY52DRAFT_1303643 [Lactarius psammicola]|nr:hypothetical protein BJY52DRAFT_1303643 [Lactarius psammicola]